MTRSPPRGGVAAGFLVLLAAPAVFAVQLDVFAASTPDAWRHLIVVAFGASLALPALAIALYTRTRGMRITWLATWAVLLVVVFVPWHPRKRFASDLFSIEPGMTVDEVEAVLRGYMKGRGRKWVVPDGSPPPCLGPGETPDPDVEARVRRAQEAYVAPRYPTGDERADATGTMTYRWNDSDEAYDSDWGVVTFEHGRVVSVEFMPD
jgi:hypothetical protein